MSNKTKDNHYVPTFYLKNFSTSNHIYQKDLKNNRIHNPDIRSVNSKKNLYTVSKKITLDELELFIPFIPEKDFEIHYDFLYTLTQFLNHDFIKLIPPNVIQLLEPENFEYLRTATNQDIARSQERLFTLYEQNSISAYNKICETRDISFLEEEKNKATNYYKDIRIYIRTIIYQCIYKELRQSLIEVIDKKLMRDMNIEIPKLSNFPNFEQNAYYDLLYHMLTQIFRTNKVITPMDTILKDIPNINPKNIIFLWIHYNCIDFAYSLLMDGFKFVLVKNDSDIDFMTSDHPCVNTYAQYGKHLQHDEFEIYLPLSPRIAILYTKKDCYRNENSFTIKNAKDVYTFNKLILDEAERYIYGTSSELLTRYNRHKNL